jgi:hypothetical protein
LKGRLENQEGDKEEEEEEEKEKACSIKSEPLWPHALTLHDRDTKVNQMPPLKAAHALPEERESHSHVLAKFPFLNPIFIKVINYH